MKYSIRVLRITSRVHLPEQANLLKCARIATTLVEPLRAQGPRGTATNHASPWG